MTPGLRVPLLMLLAAFVPAAAAAQQIQIDRGVRAGDLWCFPLVTDARTYVYLPAAARLATDEKGRPQFSFVRYVSNDAASPGSSGGIAAAGGGGVLHFLVTLDTPAVMVDAAQKSLRETLNDNAVTLRGPIVFADGRYSLVSSILSPAGKTEPSMLATGRAPVLEGNRIAFSFDLPPDRATLLLRSFEMKTPDVSLVFDMTFAGLNDAYDADLTIDWSEVRKNQSFSAGGSVYYVGADVDLAFDQLRRDNAIKLRSSGSDAAMEGLLNTVYSKLLELMFRPVEPAQVPEDQRGGLVDALNALAHPKGALGSRKLTGFGLNVGYQLKEMRSSGVSRLEFNHRALSERHSFITFNIGDLYRQYGKDPAFFRAVNLADPTFQQREIHVGIDGALMPEFEKFINGVTLTLRKQHQNGQETLRELVLDRQKVASTPGGFLLVYGWNGDDDRQAWLHYDYRTRWSFKGGGTHQTEWTTADGPMIDLFAPYERRVVQIVGNREALTKQQVRAVVVLVEYPFFGARRSQTVVVRPDQEAVEPQVEITLPTGVFQYDYVVTWQLEGSRKLTTRGQDSGGVVFIDELPSPSSGTTAPGSSQPLQGRQ
jgi:hypothetical protein